jgi:preprotein translocase subunit YajC
MPVAGFRPGDHVVTPAGNVGTVTRVRQNAGRELVTVRYVKRTVEFAAGSLRLLDRG